MWQTPCHLPELGLTARLQTGAWVGLNHEGRVWGTGEWASAPRPGCRHCSLSHRLVATALGTASLHPSLPPLGEEETEAQGPQPSHGHTHRAWSLCPEPCPPPSHPSGLSVCSQRLGQQDASPCGPGLPQALGVGLGPQLLFPEPHGRHPGEAPRSWAFRRGGSCER